MIKKLAKILDLTIPQLILLISFLISLLFIGFLVLIPEVTGFEVITENPFETLIWEIMCPRLNLSDNHCLLFLQELANRTPEVHNFYIDNSTIINKTQHYYETEVINNITEITIEKSIVVNQTKVINQTESYAMLKLRLEHEQEMAKISLEQNKTEFKIDLSPFILKSDLDNYVTHAEIPNLVQRQIIDNTPPNFNQNNILANNTTALLLIFIIIMGAIMGYLFVRNRNLQVKALRPRQVVINQPQTKEVEMKNQEQVQKEQVQEQQIKQEEQKQPQNILFKHEEDLFADEKASTEY